MSDIPKEWDCKRFSQVFKLNYTNRITLGTIVYYPIGLCSTVTAAQIHTKGSDASNEHNEEIDESDQEFSDDEEERRASLLRKRRRRRKSNNNQDEKPIKKQMTQIEPTPAPPSSTYEKKVNQSRETNIVVSKSTTADELLNQEAEGTLVNTTNGANVVGFFEPLEPLEVNGK